MPKDNGIEKIDETMKSESKTEVLDDLEEIEKKIKMLDPRNQEEPIDYEKKVEMLDLLFPIRLGNKVENKHKEIGYVGSVCIDRRGVLYLVRYEGHKEIWETEFDIKDITFKSESEPISNIVTDITSENHE